MPGATNIRIGVHRRRGETTKSIERGYVGIRDWLRGSRGIKSVTAGQRFWKAIEAGAGVSCGRARPPLDVREAVQIGMYES